MSKLFSTFFFLVLISTTLFCQYEPGARQIALANSDAAQADDVFAVFSNPGGVSQMNWREVGIYYSPAPFGFRELANCFFAYHEPFSFGSLELGIMTYGFELYRESEITIGVASNLRNQVFAGLTSEYRLVTIKNYGSAGTFCFNAGLLIYLYEYIRCGFSVHNFTHSTFAEFDDQIPVVLNTGVSADITSCFTFNAALEKDIRYNASVKFGFEYQVIKFLSIRSGFSNEPSRFTAGIGIIYSLLSLDYAVFTHNDLGLTHQAGIILSFGSEEPRKQKVRKYLGIE